MELISLAVLAIVIVVVIWLFNFDRPLRQVAEMANNQVAAHHAEHKAKMVVKLSKIELNTENVKKAKEVLAQIDSFDL